MSMCRIHNRSAGLFYWSKVLINTDRSVEMSTLLIESFYRSWILTDHPTNLVNSMKVASFDTSCSVQKFRTTKNGIAGFFFNLLWTLSMQSIFEAVFQLCLQNAPALERLYESSRNLHGTFIDLSRIFVNFFRIIQLYLHKLFTES